MGKVLLDFGCSKTVCGEAWLNRFLDTLTTVEKDKIIFEDSAAVYRFDDGKRMTAIKCVTLPCVLAGKMITIKTDVRIP